MGNLIFLCSVLNTPLGLKGLVSSFGCTVCVKSEPQVDSMVCGAGDVTFEDCNASDRRSGDLRVGDLSVAGCFNERMFKLCRPFEDVESLNATFVLGSCNQEMEIIFFKFRFKDIA